MVSSCMWATITGLPNPWKWRPFCLGCLLSSNRVLSSFSRAGFGISWLSISSLLVLWCAALGVYLDCKACLEVCDCSNQGVFAGYVLFSPGFCIPLLTLLWFPVVPGAGFRSLFFCSLLAILHGLHLRESYAECLSAVILQWAAVSWSLLPASATESI